MTEQLNGNESSPQISLEPVFLLDDNLSYHFAPALNAVGFNVTSVREKWPDRDIRSNPVLDEEIIPYLGSLGRERSVWVTSDWDAHKAHARMILAEKISVLWLNEPTGKSLTGLRELQLLTRIINTVNGLLASTEVPIYLRAYMNGLRPKMDRLAGTLLDPILRWDKVTLLS